MRAFRPGAIRIGDCSRVVARLGHAMKAHRITFQALAERHGAIDPETVSRWLRGRHAPTVAELADLLSIFGIELVLTRRRKPTVPPCPRFRPRRIPAHAHPIIREFFAEVNRLRLTSRAIAQASGRHYITVNSWASDRCPRVDVFEEVAGPLGLALATRHQAEEEAA